MGDARDDRSVRMPSRTRITQTEMCCKCLSQLFGLRMVSNADGAAPLHDAGIFSDCTQIGLQLLQRLSPAPNDLCSTCFQRRLHPGVSHQLGLTKSRLKFRQLLIKRRKTLGKHANDVRQS